MGGVLIVVYSKKIVNILTYIAICIILIFIFKSKNNENDYVYIFIYSKDIQTKSNINSDTIVKYDIEKNKNYKIQQVVEYYTKNDKIYNIKNISIYISVNNKYKNDYNFYVKSVNDITEANNKGEMYPNTISSINSEIVINKKNSKKIVKMNSKFDINE